MDLIGLNELAATIGKSRKRTLTMVRAAGRHLVLQSHPGGKIFVNREAIDLLKARENKELADRVAATEGNIQALRQDVDNLKARVA